MSRVRCKDYKTCKVRQCRHWRYHERGCLCVPMHCHRLGKITECIVAKKRKRKAKRSAVERRAAQHTIYACSPAAVEALYAAVGRPLKKLKGR